MVKRCKQSSSLQLCNSASLHLHLPFVIVIVIVNANGIVNEYVPAVTEPFFMLISSTFTQNPTTPPPHLSFYSSPCCVERLKETLGAIADCEILFCLSLSTTPTPPTETHMMHTRTHTLKLYSCALSTHSCTPQSQSQSQSPSPPQFAFLLRLLVSILRRKFIRNFAA